MKTFHIAAILFVTEALLVTQVVPQDSSSCGKLPRIVLWAWERPENLDFIDPNKVAVAFLAQTIELTSDQVIVRPRLQPLKVPDGTRLIAVARLSTNVHTTPIYSVRQSKAVAAKILQLCSIPGVSGIQVDFDAKRSERQFYRSLLIALRSQLPHTVSLSMTALASWCLADSWLADLPVEDAIPMLFRLGPDRLRVLQHLEAGKDFAFPLCRQSIGVSTDEPFPVIEHRKRIYVFNPRSWTIGSYHDFLKEYGQ
jgi:hypothetical protein